MTTMIGREHELDQILKLLDIGTPPAILVFGEAGIG